MKMPIPGELANAEKQNEKKKNEEKKNQGTEVRDHKGSERIFFLIKY